MRVFDRFTLVLHIFRCNARTREARMQLALAEIPLLRFAGGAPCMSSFHVFTPCPPRESVGAAACSASHMSLDAVAGYSLYVVPTCPSCVSSGVSVDAATGAALHISSPRVLCTYPWTLWQGCSLCVLPSCPPCLSPSRSSVSGDSAQQDQQGWGSRYIMGSGKGQRWVAEILGRRGPWRGTRATVTRGCDWSDVVTEL